MPAAVSRRRCLTCCSSTSEWAASTVMSRAQRSAGYVRATIAVTGNATLADAEAYGRAGFTSTSGKPFGPSELRAALEGAVAHAAASVRARARLGVILARAHTRTRAAPRGLSLCTKPMPCQSVRGPRSRCPPKQVRTRITVPRPTKQKGSRARTSTHPHTQYITTRRSSRRRRPPPQAMGYPCHPCHP